MATQNDKLDFAQPANALTEIAERVHPNALADGDDEGRGTGKFLDIHNFGAGTSTDINERTDDIKINKYNDKNPYSVTD